MSVYVDGLMQHGEASYHGTGAGQAKRTGARHGHQWCHLFADTEAELIDFAVKKLGMKPQWIQRGTVVHFDLVPPRRARAVKLGAKEIGSAEVRELIRRARSAA